MAGEPKLHPPMMWAQRNDKVYLTINLEDCENPNIELTEDFLYFRSIAGHDRKEYEIKVEFFKPIDFSKSKQSVQARNIVMVLIKKEEGPYWPRLLKDKVKQGWLKTDFNKWKDEEESDEDQGKEADLAEMMSRMGQFNPTSAAEDFVANEDEPDSDDDDLPDLEA